MNLRHYPIDDLHANLKDVCEDVVRYTDPLQIMQGEEPYLILINVYRWSSLWDEVTSSMLDHLALLHWTDQDLTEETLLAQHGFQRPVWNYAESISIKDLLPVEGVGPSPGLKTLSDSQSFHRLHGTDMVDKQQGLLILAIAPDAWDRLMAFRQWLEDARDSPTIHHPVNRKRLLAVLANHQGDWVSHADLKTQSGITHDIDFLLSSVENVERKGNKRFKYRLCI